MRNGGGCYKVKDKDRKKFCRDCSAKLSGPIFFLNPASCVSYDKTLTKMPKCNESCKFQIERYLFVLQVASTYVQVC